MVVSEQATTLTNINSNNFIFTSQLSEFIHNNTEPTIDLSNIQEILQAQSMPISELLAANAATSSSIASHSGKPTLVYLQNEKTHESADSCSYESENTCDYEEEVTNGKRKAATIGNAGRAKRTSTTSNTSSSIGELTATRGRGGRRTARVASLVTSEQSDEGTVARFGNKVVVKGTEEYNDRRNKNNDAVKKCRAKLQEKQAEREERLKKLTEENRKLTNTVDSLNKELNVLKGILSTMKPQYTLPSDIEEKIKKLESMIIANNSKA